MRRVGTKAEHNVSRILTRERIQDATSSVLKWETLEALMQFDGWIPVVVTGIAG